MTPSVLITRPLPDRVISEALTRFSLTLREDTTPMTKAQCIEALQNYDAVLMTLRDPFEADVFEAAPAPRCRLLANFGVGYNHIDIAAARAAGVEVTNTPGAVTDATADTALTLMLMTARRAGEAERLVRSGKWEGWHPTQMLGMHMTGKRLGVIGFGRIGKAIAKRAHFGFDMEVSFHNRSTIADPGMPAVQTGLDEVLATSDIVVIAAPANPSTHHLIGAAELAKMQPQAILVNIDIVDEAALVTALTERRIAGAGLDVYEFEPRISPELLTMENVTLLPHLGTAALDVRETMGLMAVDNLKAFFDGASLPNPV